MAHAGRTKPVHEVGKAHVVDVDGRPIALRNLDKVLYPETGTTKAEVIDYYARVADAILPHLRDRMVTLKRYPDGVEGESFFEKACPGHRPQWMRTSSRFSVHRGSEVEYCLVNDRASLIWLANLAVLEFHVPLAKRRSMDRPTTMVFDLDPGPGNDVIDCARIALIVRERLAEDGLESLIKTSGSKGMQLYVPLNRRGVDFDQTKAYARAIAEELTERFPNDIVANMRKELRRGKVLIDWSQNDSHKTTICAYSLRGRPHPNVSTPVTWQEVADAVRAGDPRVLSFSFKDTLRRVRELGDLFAPVNEMTQRLPARMATGTAA